MIGRLSMGGIGVGGSRPVEGEKGMVFTDCGSHPCSAVRLPNPLDELFPAPELMSSRMRKPQGMRDAFGGDGFGPDIKCRTFELNIWPSLILLAYGENTEGGQDVR